MAFAVVHAQDQHHSAKPLLDYPTPRVGSLVKWAIRDRFAIFVNQATAGVD